MQEREQPRTSNILRLFAQAVKGVEQDYTTGSINKAIFMLSVPMILEMVMESLFAVVDVFFVSKLGTDAIATVGLTESMLTILYSVAWGISMGATALVARRIGEKNPDGAAHGGMQAIYVGVIISVIVSIAGIFFAKELLMLMGAEQAMADANYRYTQLLMGSNIVIMLLFLINGIFRGAGDASIAMRSLWIANILNIILCPTLINGFGPIPAMGLTGAALATTIGRGVGVLYQLYHLFNGKGVIRILRKHISFDFPVMGSVLKLASGGTAQFLIASASWIFLVKILADYGSDALAGYTIAIRVIVFTILPAWGMANAAATLVGQNLGAQLPDRAEQSVWKAAKYNMFFLVTVAILFFTGAEWIMMFFTTNKDVIASGVKCLRFVSLGYALLWYGSISILQWCRRYKDTYYHQLVWFLGIPDTIGIYTG